MQTNLIQSIEQGEIFTNWLFGKITDEEFDKQMDQLEGGINK